MGDRLSRWRLLAGFAVLPPAQWVVGYLGFPVVWWLGDNRAFQRMGDDALRFAMFTAILGIGLTMFAVPVVWCLRRLNLISLGSLLLAGLLIGNVPFGFFVFGLVVPATIQHVAAGTMSDHLVPVSSLVAGTLRALLIGSTVGLISSALFWLIAIRSSPALSESAPPAE